MTGKVVQKLSQPLNQEQVNGSGETPQILYDPIEIATAVSLLVGILQVRSYSLKNDKKLFFTMLM